MTTENNTPTEPTAEEVAAQAAAAAAAAKAAGVGGDPTLPVSTGTPPVVKEPTAEEKAAAEKAAAESKDEPIVYNPTGDAGLDMLLEAVGGMKMGPDHPAVVAAIDGDFSLLSAEMAKREVKGYDRLIALGEKAFTDIRAKTTARQAEDLKAVHAEAGGPEQWAEVQKWAATNADDGEKKEISAMLGKGGVQARMAAAWLTNAYSRANGISDDGAGREVTTGAKGDAGTTGALSPKEYAAAVIKARVGFKGDFENSAVYKGLQARRMAYRG